MSLRQKLGFRALRFGLKLLRPVLPANTYWALDSAVNDAELVCKIKPPRYTITDGELISLIQETCDCYDIDLWDGTYYYTDIGSFRKMTNTDMVNRMRYISEVNDCDDFARDFQAYMDIFFQLNSVGIATGTVTDENGNTGMHAWNCVILRDGGKTKVFYYEPQSDGLAEVKNGEAKIGSWTYSAQHMIFG